MTKVKENHTQALDNNNKNSCDKITSTKLCKSLKNKKKQNQFPRKKKIGLNDSRAPIDNSQARVGRYERKKKSRNRFDVANGTSKDEWKGKQSSHIIGTKKSKEKKGITLKKRRRRSREKNNNTLEWILKCGNFCHCFIFTHAFVRYITILCYWKYCLPIITNYITKK